jgi:hypothetical protein
VFLLPIVNICAAWNFSDRRGGEPEERSLNRRGDCFTPAAGWSSV